MRDSSINLVKFTNDTIEKIDRKLSEISYESHTKTISKNKLNNKRKKLSKKRKKKNSKVDTKIRLKKKKKIQLIKIIKQKKVKKKLKVKEINRKINKLQVKTPKLREKNNLNIKINAMKNIEEFTKNLIDDNKDKYLIKELSNNKNEKKNELINVKNIFKNNNNLIKVENSYLEAIKHFFIKNNYNLNDKIENELINTILKELRKKFVNILKFNDVPNESYLNIYKNIDLPLKSYLYGNDKDLLNLFHEENALIKKQSKDIEYYEYINCYQPLFNRNTELDHFSLKKFLDKNLEKFDKTRLKYQTNCKVCIVCLF